MTAAREMIGERVHRLGAEVGRLALADDLLQLMRRHGQPIGAYELIALLKARRGKRPNIYKTLNALAARGKIVRLASLRRYWALPEALPKPALLLACRVCGRVELTSSEPVRLGLSRKRGDRNSGPVPRLPGLDAPPSSQ